MIGMAVFLAAMAMLTLLWSVRPVHIGIIGGITTLWGGAAFWNSPAIQARLHALAGPVAPQALALNTSATSLGVAVGGAVGGALLTAWGPGALPVTSAGFGIVALLTLALAVRVTSPGHARR